MALKQKSIETGTIPLSCGRAERILHPATYFKENSTAFTGVVKAVRAAFGTEMTEEDIFNHLVLPQKTYLLTNGGGVFGMSSYTSKRIFEENVLYLDGIAIHPEMQGRGIFKELTAKVMGYDEQFIALRTQSPRMYASLSKFCSFVYPNHDLKCPKELRKILKGMEKNLGMKTNELGVAENFYGKSLYSEEQSHPTASMLFNKVLKVDCSRGDTVLCIGIKNGKAKACNCC